MTKTRISRPRLLYILAEALCVCQELRAGHHFVSEDCVRIMEGPMPKGVKKQMVVDIREVMTSVKSSDVFFFCEQGVM